ncbi:MAG: WYL domain-containing protein [Gemmatimonadaceae bacterium]|nr:WYL domain-containing protein [Gemmatimonadaceae bacterium]
MDKIDRVYGLHRLLASRRTAISLPTIMERLECSRATAYRLIGFLRDHLGAPVAADSDGRGFRYDIGSDSAAYELPGLWFSARELHALAVLQQMLSTLGPGLLEEELAPLAKRIGRLLDDRRLNLREMSSRLRLLAMSSRKPGTCFLSVATATLQRRRLQIVYRSRGKDEVTGRTVSPQRLVHYRDNWYLDAWDELRAALRSFAIDRIQCATVLDDVAIDRSDAELDGYFGSAYGIFAGPATRTAVLRFSAERARWVAEENWHPHQEGRFLPGGRYELQLPYGDPRELLMDILRHGVHVEVVAPPELRREVIDVLNRTLSSYVNS